MQEMLELCSTLTGAGMMAFLGFTVVGITIFVAASLVWRDNEDYWTDVAGFMIASAGVSFVLAVASLMPLMVWGIGKVAADGLTAAFGIVFAVIGLATAEKYLKSKGRLIQRVQTRYILATGAAFAIATMLSIAVSCAYLAEIRAALAR